LATNRAWLLDFVDSLISTTGWVDKDNNAVTPSNMGVVYYSSNSTVPGTGVAGDGVNRWTTATDLVWQNAGVAHSWTVIYFAALGAYLLVSCENFSSGFGDTIVLIVSPVPFSGGTATTRPTSTVEIPLINASALGASGSVATDLRLHALKDTTGKHWRIFNCKGGIPNTTIMLEEAEVHNPLWTTPNVFYGAGSTSSSTATVSLMNGSYNFYARAASTTMALAASIPHVGGALLTASITSANGIDSTWPFIEHNLVTTTATKNGKHGYIKDWWWAPAALTTGMTGPTTPPPGQNQHQFAVVGNTFQPWCSIPMLVA
jgi:hypothetical protein